MANRKRSWTDITVDILEVTRTPANKMRIMYRANLNFDRFNKYFHDLVRKGFIEEIEVSNPSPRRVFKITERGMTLLEVLKKANELNSAKELQAS